MKKPRKPPLWVRESGCVVVMGFFLLCFWMGDDKVLILPWDDFLAGIALCSILLVIPVIVGHVFEHEKDAERLNRIAPELGSILDDPKD